MTGDDGGGETRGEIERFDRPTLHAAKECGRLAGRERYVETVELEATGPGRGL